MQGFSIWPGADKQAAKSGADPWLTTIMLNESTFSADDIKGYPYHLRREYLLEPDMTDETRDGVSLEPVTFYAADDACAWRWAEMHYNLVDGDVLSRVERTTTHTDVPRPAVLA